MNSRYKPSRNRSAMNFKLRTRHWPAMLWRSHQWERIYDLGTSRWTTSMVLGMVVLVLGLLGWRYWPTSEPIERPKVETRVKETLSELNVPFVKNEGQLAEAVRFSASLFSGNLFVTDNALTYALTYREQPAQEGGNFHDRLQARLNETSSGTLTRFAFKEYFQKENQPVDLQVSGGETPGGNVSIFRGKAEHWQSGVPSYEYLTLGSPWEQIEVHLKATGTNVEKLFTVQPGGDPTKIQMGLDGIETITRKDNGELTLASGAHQLTLTNPVAYQYDYAGNKQYVSVSYEKKGDLAYGFAVDQYDNTQPLIIDPLVSSTYLGGIADEHYGYDNYGAQLYTGHPAIAQDSEGNIYVVTQTQSGDYPTTLGVIDTSFNDSGSILKNDIVISKFNSTLTSLLASTYLGGTSEDSGASIQLDGANNVYITGFTRSEDFPTTAGAFRPLYQGGATATVLRPNSRATSIPCTAAPIWADRTETICTPFCIPASACILSGTPTRVTFPPDRGRMTIPKTGAMTRWS